jgi:hypothetical protein
MVRSKMLTTPTSVQQQEILLEAAAVSQATSDMKRDDSLGGSTGENDLWQGLKAPSTYHDQRSKFRQQASPYVRPT